MWDHHHSVAKTFVLRCHSMKKYTFPKSSLSFCNVMAWNGGDTTVPQSTIFLVPCPISFPVHWILSGGGRPFGSSGGTAREREGVTQLTRSDYFLKHDARE